MAAAEQAAKQKEKEERKAAEGEKKKRKKVEGQPEEERSKKRARTTSIGHGTDEHSRCVQGLVCSLLVPGLSETDTYALVEGGELTVY